MFGWMFHSLPNVSLCLIHPMCVCEAQHYAGIVECFSNTGQDFCCQFVVFCSLFLKVFLSLFSCVCVCICVCDAQNYENVECFSNTGQQPTPGISDLFVSQPKPTQQNMAVPRTKFMKSCLHVKNARKCSNA